MAKAMKQPDWRAMFERMSNTRYSPESLYAMFQEARENAIASRTVDDSLKYRQPLKR